MLYILVLVAQHGPSIPFLLADNICADRKIFYLGHKNIFIRPPRHRVGGVGAICCVSVYKAVLYKLSSALIKTFSKF